MSRSPIVAAVLEKSNAVLEFRNLIGDTDPATAKKGTIRSKYAISKGENTSIQEQAGMNDIFIFFRS